MSTSLRYLEKAKIEELARDYEENGYQVTTDYRDDGVIYDLIASKGQVKVAIEVKARAALSTAAPEIKRQRQLAQEQGYDFQLYIVNPPRERAIAFEELTPLLLDYVSNHIPSELAQLSSSISVNAVSKIDIAAINIDHDGIHVSGTGMVEVALEYSGGKGRDGIAWDTEFPFDFALSLDRHFEIAEVEELRIDTATFYE